jgi:small GTP-binding protein
MNDTQQKYIFKIIVIGDGFVGKTSLIKKFTQGSFQEDYIQTIGAQFSIFEQELEGDKCKLFFWDIAGQDEFHFLRPAFYKDSKAAIVVFSLEENNLGKDSFKHITNWNDDIRNFCGDIPVVIFANKVDLVDKKSIDDKRILKIVKKKNLLGYYLTSAKTGEGVNIAFQEIIRNLYDKYKTIFSELRSKS